MEKRNNPASEIKRRKTFAIISHPDAGKTTLTEKLLLYGGAIRLAGSVKARKSQKHAVSDWMEIEKQRGISVTSSVMQFDYDGYHINILDTPGHQDFSEDTYRTLLAADSAVMLIDGAKGVEEQTKKLFHVCKMRGIPIFTFVNKLDRYCKSPFELMEELEQVLGINAYPMNWPVGKDGRFLGVYDRNKAQVQLFDAAGKHGSSVLASKTGSVDDPEIANLLDDATYDQLCEDIELLDIAGDDFDREKIDSGELTPMFFGSAMTNFGVEPFLREFLKLAPQPTPRSSTEGVIDTVEEGFSGFVFKVQANMNPAHRDRLAFIRICSGKFEAGMEVHHVQAGKNVRLAQPQQFLAQDRTIIDEAYAGDIIGVFDPGIFQIGDTLCETKRSFVYDGIPVFPAEHFAKVQFKDAMKRKQFIKGITQISEEGAIQVFKQPNIGVETLIIGVVGVLQFQVLEYRLKNEYGVDILIHQLPYKGARWVIAENFTAKSMGYTDAMILVEDKFERPVVLFKDPWFLDRLKDKHAGLELKEIPPAVNAVRG